MKCFREEGNHLVKESITRDSLIQHHVVPLMRGMHEMMSLMQGVDDGFKLGDFLFFLLSLVIPDFP